MTAEISELLNLEQKLVHESHMTYKLTHYLNLYSKTWSDELYAIFLKSFNEYLEQVAPLKYIPHIVERLTKEIVIPLWEVDVNSDNIIRLLNGVLKIKKYGARETELTELKRTTEELLFKLGVDEPRKLFAECTSVYSEEDCLATITVIALILSTNP